MKITGFFKDFNLIYGNSYQVMTDGEYSYQVSPESENTIFVGWIDWVKHRHDGIVQIRYVKGFLIPFTDHDPITGEPANSVNEVIHHLLAFMTNNPNEFESMFK